METSGNHFGVSVKPRSVRMSDNAQQKFRIGARSLVLANSSRSRVKSKASDCAVALCSWFVSLVLYGLCVDLKTKDQIRTPVKILDATRCLSRRQQSNSGKEPQ